MAYPHNGVCPSDHPVPVPEVVMELTYHGVRGGSGITLSSGSYYTMHSDYWNTWRQSALADLVQRCLDRHQNCRK
jgi:hypothetical protein